MKIAIIAASLALVGGLGAAAPAEAQYYGHHYGYHRVHRGYGYGVRGGYGYRHRGYGPRYGYHGGYGHGGYGHGGYGHGGYGHGGYRQGRRVCTYRHGLRRCF